MSQTINVHTVKTECNNDDITERDHSNRILKFEEHNTGMIVRLSGRPQYRHHTYIHTCIQIYIHTYVHTYIHTYVHTYIRAYIHTCMHTYIHTYIHTYKRAYMRIYIHTYIHTQIQTYVCTVWTYTHVVKVLYKDFHCSREFSLIQHNLFGKLPEKEVVELQSDSLHT